MIYRRNKKDSKSSFCAGLLLLLLALLINMQEGFAQEIDAPTALTVAKQFYLSHSSQFAGATAKFTRVDYHFELVEQLLADSADACQKKNTARNSPLYYVFNVNEDDGFVIVAGSEKIKPILAYAFRGSFKASGKSPAFLAWMENYKNQILFVLEDNSETEPGITEEWNRYKSENQLKGQPQYNPVGPFLSTSWGQGMYYNNSCPPDSTSTCTRAPAGCVAVAMAQILKFWEYPDLCNAMEGYPSDAYEWIEGIAPTPYDWSLMPEALDDSSGESEIEEVSKLIHHCGVSVKMSYGSRGSFAACSAIPEALSEHFSYGSLLQYIERIDYSPKAWENVLKVELDFGRPLLFIAKDPNAIHAFVCDGYQDPGYFHFNWGWNGYHDGYYYLDEMAVRSYHFTQNQRAVIGIEPEYQQPDPWEQVIPIEGCGSAHTYTFKGGDMGSWTAGICDWSTPGREQIYSFVAPESGTYSLDVTSVNGYVDCGWKELYGGKQGWNCVGDIYKPGEYGAMTWTAGKTYYILLDDEDIAPDHFQFHIHLLDSSTPALANEVSAIKVFPNPVNDLLNIECDTPGRNQLKISSLNGFQLYLGEMEGTGFQIDLSSFPAGIYILTIRAKDAVSTWKVMKL